jgi:outer membrane protein OmpA-like peptidoglycan-associated protein
LDIFKTYKLDKINWAPPANLKSPVNSGGDDFGLIVASNTINKPSLLKEGDIIRSGFFTSNRPNDKAKGMDDIYQFTQRVPPPPPPVPIDTVPKKEIVHQIIIEGYVVEKIYIIADDPNSKVLGRRPLDKVSVNIEGQEKPIVLKTGPDGYFKIIAAAQKDYKFTANKEEYLSNYTKFSTKGIGKDPNKPIQTFEVEIVLDKIYRNKEIVLENIYYDYDRWDIRPDAEPTLNKLAEMLAQNPTIRIQLGSHTDCRGNDSYNQNLSQKRAESAVNYLTGKGISTERLSAIGYGEGNPAAGCNCNKCTEQEHQQNRRTTFKIE